MDTATLRKIFIAHDFNGDAYQAMQQPDLEQLGSWISEGIKLQEEVSQITATVSKTKKVQVEQRVRLHELYGSLRTITKKISTMTAPSLEVVSRDKDLLNSLLAASDAAKVGEHLVVGKLLNEVFDDQAQKAMSEHLPKSLLASMKRIVDKMGSFPAELMLSPGVMAVSNQKSVQVVNLKPLEKSAFGMPQHDLFGQLTKGDFPPVAALTNLPIRSMGLEEVLGLALVAAPKHYHDELRKLEDVGPSLVELGTGVEILIALGVGALIVGAVTAIAGVVLVANNCHPGGDEGLCVLGGILIFVGVVLLIAGVALTGGGGAEPVITTIEGVGVGTLGL
jgi:hypothetical protein